MAPKKMRRPTRFRALANLAFGTVLAFVGHDARADDEDLARELPRIKPLEPAAALESFRIHPGFHLEPVAVEPVVTDPVAACYDADGRLYVAEMRGYPFPEKTPSGNVSRLEDRDGDGRFETRTIFVGGLSWPTGIVPYDGGVFIAVAPDILYAKDTDGDGVADIKKFMFTGFGIDNVQGLLNGLLWGPDGWIYGVTSSNGGTIQNRSRPESRPVSVRGRDFRFKPDGSAFEAISGGGQFGHCFDDWGHRFTCNNSNHVRQVVLPSHYLERNPALIPPPVILDIAAEGAAARVYRISPPEPWRVVRTRQRAADPVLSRRLPPTELFATGFFTSATGITIYRGSSYPSIYGGNVLVGDAGGNLVHRKLLKVDGATYLASRADLNEEFLASTDNWFRPVNFANTPDGTLLILDMYRETIEHPFSIPEPIKKHLDLTSGKDRGRLYNLAHTGTSRRPKPNLSVATSAELVQRLADPDAWWRETAQRLLIERHDQSVVSLLRATVKDRPNQLKRLHALWVLKSLDALDDGSIRLGLSDSEPRIREQAIRLAERRLKHEPAILQQLLALVDDPDPMVRFQLAFSLGEANDDPRAITALALIAERDIGSAWVRTAVLSSIAGRALPLVDALANRAGFFMNPASQPWLDELAFQVGSGPGPGEIDEFLRRLRDAGARSDTVMSVVLALARGHQRSGGSFQKMLDGCGAETSGRMASLLAEAVQVAGSDGALERRLVAIRLIAIGDTKTSRSLFPTLLDARQPSLVQLTVLQALAGLLDREMAQRIVLRWRSMSPAVRREAVEVLFGRRAGIDAVIGALESRAMTASELDPARLLQLRTHSDAALRTRAQKVLASATMAARDRGQVIAFYRPALTLVGERDRGQEIFFKICATCHQAAGRGVSVGPDLATVTGRSTEDLLVHILDPNREVAPNYVNYNVVTDNGRVASGIIADESAIALVLKRGEGATNVIPRDKIEAITSTGVSLMPDGLEKGLSSQDLANLIAFLRSIRPSTGSIAPPAAGK
jgi:putative membrane-bound dehydrogenase-like protein